MQWLRQLLDWQNEVEDPGEFLDSLRFEINTAEVYVFTPRGDVIGLPSDPTPVDFAYAIHTEVGHHTIGARVNGRLVPLESTLEHGDVVEVFTSKSPNAGPSRDWLTFVKSPRARSKIRHWFTKERREEAIEQGKDQIGRLLRKEGMPLKRVMTHESLTQVASELRLADVSALYAAVGEGNLGAQTVVRKVIEVFGGDDGRGGGPRRGRARSPRPRRAEDRRSDSGVIVKGALRRAGQARPLLHAGAGRRDPRLRHPGRRGLGAPPRLHQRRRRCSASPSVWSRWSGRRPPSRPSSCRSWSRPSTVPGCSPTSRWSLSEQHVNILSASLTTTRDRVAKSRFSFEMGDPKHLGAVLKSVRQIDGVFDAYRVTQLSRWSRASHVATVRG